MSLRRVLAPLASVYGACAAANHFAFDHGWRGQRRLQWPVVSIGNISAGGAGKTPFTVELARLFQEHGSHVDILSRGYSRRSSAAVERVPPGNGDAARYGDEPVLLAQATGVPVYVGASRFSAGLLAEREAGAAGLPRNTHDGWLGAVHLLDDGFQHRQLARAADIVLLHPRDAADALLPAGNLREPFSALRRADFLVLRDGDAETVEVLRSADIETPVWRVRRRIAIPPVQGPVVAFAGIAHPEEFFAGLRAAGLDVQRTFAFGDHHRFSRAELRAIVDASAGSAAILTTEKDMARLGLDAMTWLGRKAALYAPRLGAELLNAPACLLALRACIAVRKS